MTSDNYGLVNKGNNKIWFNFLAVENLINIFWYFIYILSSINK